MIEVHVKGEPQRAWHTKPLRRRNAKHSVGSGNGSAPSSVVQKLSGDSFCVNLTDGGDKAAKYFGRRNRQFSAHMQ